VSPLSQRIGRYGGISNTSATITIVAPKYLVDTQRAIIIDAVDTGAPPGTLVRLTGYAVARAFAAGTTAHEVGLRDLLGVALLTGAWPEVLVLHGAQPAGTSPGAELTPAVAAALDPLVDVVMVDLSAA
jgi:hydrogenase maturation protease